MLKNSSDIILLVNDDLTSNKIFLSVLKCASINVKMVVFDANVIGDKQGLIRGGMVLLKSVAKDYWCYQVFLLIYYKLVSAMPFILFKTRPTSTLRGACRKYGIPFTISNNFNDEALIKTIKDLTPDYLFIRCSQIIKGDLLAVAGGKTFCVHSSLLPSYKGIAAEYHAMANNESKIGSSIFQVTETLDAGATVRQVSMHITPGKSHFWHVMKNNKLASKMVVDFLQFPNDIPVFLKCTESYFSWPQREDACNFKRNGWKLISMRELFDLIQSIFIGSTARS